MLASSTASSEPQPPVPLTAFLRSVTPALDSAFGLAFDPDLPDELAVLVARLHDEPKVDVGERMAAPLLEPEPMVA